MPTNARKIDQWREANPDICLTEGILLEILGLKTLEWADLSGADLRCASLGNADLRWADLRWAGLRWAGLRWADLHGANLLHANLWGADLSGADLSGANLWGADLREVRVSEDSPILQIATTPSGEVTMVPTCEGWRINIGCERNWTIEDLEDLLAGRREWPQARGKEIKRRRRILKGVHVLAVGHARYHKEALDAVAHWADKK